MSLKVHIAGSKIRCLKSALQFLARVGNSCSALQIRTNRSALFKADQVYTMQALTS